MAFNEDKKKKLVELLAKRRAAAAGVGTSSPTTPPPSATSTPNTTEPAPVDNSQKGVVAVVVDSEDEDTYTVLVFKRLRVGEAVAPSHSTSGGLTPAFKDNPPSASSPRNLIVHEGGGESTPKGQQMPPPLELHAFLQEALKRFQDQDMVKSLEGNFLQICVARGLGDFLVASSLALIKAQEMQDLQVKMKKLKEELVLKTKAFSNHETAMYQELASLRQSEKDVKKLLFDKSQEVVQLEAKIFPLHNKVVDLEEKVEGMQAKMAKLEERATQREVQLGQVEGELAEKVELFKKDEEELTNDVADAYYEGFQDAIAQFACMHPKVDLSPFTESKCVVDGQLVLRE